MFEKSSAIKAVIRLDANVEGGTTGMNNFPCSLLFLSSVFPLFFSRWLV